LHSGAVPSAQGEHDDHDGDREGHEEDVEDDPARLLLDRLDRVRVDLDGHVEVDDELLVGLRPAGFAHG
jgi:hypothetical protein